MRRNLILKLVATAVLIAAPALALADIGWGPRGGITVDPDQPHLGMHLDAGYLADNLRFQPNFEIGFSDNSTLAALNAELNYLFSSVGNGWYPYLGGGVGLFSGNGNMDAGLSALGGIERSLNSGNRFFTEVKLGLIDAPDLKWSVGWTFTH